MTRTQDRLITAALCFGLAIVVHLDTSSYPASRGEGFGQGPAFYPECLAAGLLVFGLCQLGSLFLGGFSSPEMSGPASNDSQARPVLPYMIFGLTLVFVWLLPWSGFLAGGVILATASAILIRNQFSPRALGISLAVGCGIIFLVWLIFSFAIGIDLPVSTFF